jgi:phosphate:Na+ symporter
MDTASKIIMTLGGIALFLFGINFLSDNLKKVAGSKLKIIIEKSTNTPIKGILLGILVTSLIQSSSATTGIVIGLLRSGILGLPSAIGIILGANIGTSVTAFIIGLPITELGYLFLLLGLISTFFKKEKIKNVGGVIMGLGLLFVGLDIMNLGVEKIIDNEYVQDLFLTFSNIPIVGVLFGTIFTGIIQSSSASIGIAQNLYRLNATGISSIQLEGALSLVLGANIGTTVTGLLSSFGGNAAGKKAALIHTFFNVFLAIIGLILFPFLVDLIIILENSFLGAYSMFSLAFFHLIVNFIAVFILFWFIKYLIKIVDFLVKDDKIGINILDEKIIVESSTLALENAKLDIINMSKIIYKYFEITKECIFEFYDGILDVVYETEKNIDLIDAELHDYLIKIAKAGVTPNESIMLSRYLDSIKDFERIGDHFTNICEFFYERNEKKSTLTDDGESDLREMMELIDKMLTNTNKAFLTNNKEIALLVINLEDTCDKLNNKFRYKYLERLKSGEVMFDSLLFFGDIYTNFERIGDHLCNISQSVIEPLYIPLEELMPKNSIKEKVNKD